MGWSHPQGRSEAKEAQSALTRPAAEAIRVRRWIGIDITYLAKSVDYPHATRRDFQEGAAGETQST